MELERLMLALRDGLTPSQMDLIGTGLMDALLGADSEDEHFEPLAWLWLQIDAAKVTNNGEHVWYFTEYMVNLEETYGPEVIPHE